MEDKKEVFLFIKGWVKYNYINILKFSRAMDNIQIKQRILLTVIYYIIQSNLII